MARFGLDWLFIQYPRIRLREQEADRPTFVRLVGSQEALRLKEPKKLSHNSLRLVLGDVVTTGVDLYDTHV